MADNVPTKARLLGIVDDIESISKCLLENVTVNKSQRLSYQEQLAKLLVVKDQDLKAALKSAEEQAEIQKEIDNLQAEIEKQDQNIHKLQTCLKEAEQSLATALYQAKQKVQTIAKVGERNIFSEELIKYSHRISSCNAVAAPYNWQRGDNRRPYPTDIEMRSGHLGRLSDMPLTGSIHPYQNPGSLSESSASHGLHGEKILSQAGMFSWQVSSNIKQQISTSSNHCVPTNTENHSKENENVEVMPTDSSSSSSSDSQ